jgi:hypothetical protein
MPGLMIKIYILTVKPRATINIYYYYVRIPTSQPATMFDRKKESIGWRSPLAMDVGEGQKQTGCTGVSWMMMIIKSAGRVIVR